MSKYRSHITTVILLVLLVMVVPHFAHAETGVTTSSQSTGFWSSVFGGGIDFIGLVVSPLALTLLKLTSYITLLGGVALNAAVYFTVIKMAENFSHLPAIDAAWGAIRDVANMGFIFVLLYTAIMTIFGEGNYRETIVRTVIAAILINFSLFFTKVIIDASNLLALTFYHAIAPGASNEFLKAGISNAIMEPMGISSIWQASGSDFSNFAVAGIMGSVVQLISAFIFFAIAVMFVIRYVVLIFVLILSPIAFVANAIPSPEIKKYASQWWDALLGQAFFAPIYFLLTWVTIIVIQGITSVTLGGQPHDWNSALQNTTTVANGANAFNPGIVSTLLNFIIIIGFLVTSLIISKSWAEKAGGGVKKLTSTALGFAGTATGWAGRTTLGRGATLLANSQLGKELVTAANTRTGAAGAASRLALYATKKAASGTYDLKNATVPTGVVSDLIRGTAGRTDIGKRLRLDEFDAIGSIPVGAKMADLSDAGKGAGKGFREQEVEDKKRWEKIKGQQSEEARLAEASVAIADGRNAPAGSPAAIAMERALAKLTNKEIEAIVEGDKQLLDSQNFANSISVKQLEALDKSEKLNEQEKDRLKNRRFSAINTAMRTGGAGATAVRNEIRGLSDSELEMINPDYVSDPVFATQMKSTQIDAVKKSSKFTGQQKRDLGNARNDALTTAIGNGNAAVAQDIIREWSPKEVAALPIATLVSPTLLAGYTPNMLKRMAQEMTTGNIQQLRAVLSTGGNPETIAWLNNPNTGFIDFS